MLDVCWRRLLVVALLGPTMVVPIPRWHHHAEGENAEHAECVLCHLDLSVDGALLPAASPDAPPAVAPLACEPLSAPPCAPAVEHPARGPPAVTR